MKTMRNLLFLTVLCTGVVSAGSASAEYFQNSKQCREVWNQKRIEFDQLSRDADQKYYSNSNARGMMNWYSHELDRINKLRSSVLDPLSDTCNRMAQEERNLDQKQRMEQAAKDKEDLRKREESNRAQQKNINQSNKVQEQIFNANNNAITKAAEAYNKAEENRNRVGALIEIFKAVTLEDKNKADKVDTAHIEIVKPVVKKVLNNNSKEDNPTYNAVSDTAGDALGKVPYDPGVKAIQETSAAAVNQIHNKMLHEMDLLDERIQDYNEPQRNQPKAVTSNFSRGSIPSSDPAYRAGASASRSQEHYASNQNVPAQSAPVEGMATEFIDPQTNEVYTVRAGKVLIRRYKGGPYESVEENNYLAESGDNPSKGAAGCTKDGIGRITQLCENLRANKK